MKRILSLFSNNAYSWNEEEPDNKRKNQNDDPWGNRNRNSNRGDGPPELDELFKNFNKWLSDFTGGKSGGGSSGSSGGGDLNFKKNFGLLAGMFSIVVAVLIGITGFYKVEPGEQAVEYRFGRYIGTQGPGPHWIFPGIYSKEIINTSVVHQKNFSDDLITKEVNIVTTNVAVQYRINNLENYLFKVKSAEESLAEATRSAIRHVIADSTLEQVLSTRGVVAVGAEGTPEEFSSGYLGDQIQDLIVDNLKYYEAGLEIQGVEILSALPPEQVREAFSDAIKAQEDEVRYVNEAEAYERRIVPVAEGKAARIIQEANTYVAQTVFAAEGEAARFTSILPEYNKARQVTRNRLYLGAMENALVNTPKIIVDSKSNNVLFLPLDKFNFDVSKVSKLASSNERKGMASSSMTASNKISMLDTKTQPQSASTTGYGRTRSVSPQRQAREWRN